MEGATDQLDAMNVSTGKAGFEVDLSAIGLKPEDVKTPMKVVSYWGQVWGDSPVESL